jgi:hypothetical protein
VEQHQNFIDSNTITRFINPTSLGLIGTLLACLLFLFYGQEKSGLDNKKVEQQIKQELEKQAGVKLKSISCPQNIPIIPAISFECTAEVKPEAPFPITVKLKDEAGNFEWEVANSQGLLNLTKLESQFQEALKIQTGKDASVTCGGKYRVNKPGDAFDCQVQPGLVAEKITVKIDDTGNVSWQTVQPATVTPTANLGTIPDAIPPLVSPSNPNLPVIPAATPATENTAATEATETTKTAKPATASSPKEATPETTPEAATEPAAASSSEKSNDFLNDPAALDDLD